MQESKNRYDLLSHIDWEGGMWNFIVNYGMPDVDSYEVSDEIKEKWEEAASLAYEVDELFSEIFTLLNTGEEEDDDEY